MRVRAVAVVGVAVGLLVGVAGCSSGASAPAGPPADGGTYANVDAVLSALSKAGTPCVEPSPVANPTLAGALSMTDCGSAAGTSDSVVVVFDTQAHALGYASELTANGSGLMFTPDAVVVYGQNWAVNTKAGFAAKVRAALGGQSVAGPSASPS